VILVDTNLLLYAYHPRAQQHEQSCVWLEEVLSGPDLVRFAWLTLWAFLRIATNPRVFEIPLSEPGERHWDILRGRVRDGQAACPLVMDAVLAAIAFEHGVTVCTTDRDFSRFSGLKWTNPLAGNR
jgi:predicted nucleic acid-binding protein